MTTASRWQHLPDRYGRIGWVILVVSVTLALLGGAAVAVWNPDTDPPPAARPECTDPPCFGGGGMPGAADVPTVLPFLGYALAMVLGVPGALMSVWSFAHHRWSQGLQRLLVFLGPLLIVVGMELIPHVVNPCLVADLAGDRLPRFCGRTESGADIADRRHALYHAIVGALPMALLYRWALRRWRPDVLSSVGMAKPSSTSVQ